MSNSERTNDAEVKSLVVLCIEVIRGPGGTIWGPNAVDGVINIITKSSKDTQGETVSAGGGNVDEGDMTVQYGSAPQGDLSYRVYGMGFVRGPEYHSDGDNYDTWQDIQSGFRVDYQKSATDTYTVQGDIYDEGAGQKVTAVYYTPPYSRILEGAARLSGGNILGRVFCLRLDVCPPFHAEPHEHRSSNHRI